MILHGFVSRKSDSSTAAVLAFPDGSYLIATLPADFAAPALTTDSPWSYLPNSAGQGSRAVHAFTTHATETFAIDPCAVPVPDGLTANDAAEVLSHFLESHADGSIHATYRSVRALSRAYEIAVEDGGAPARQRVRVEDRTQPLVLADGEVLTRPNGETYLPRDLVGHTDAAALRRARDGSMYALLRGEPGTGKTALADATFPDLVMFSCTGDTTVSHLVGSWMPNPDGTFRWQDGPLTVAMREGRVFLADEIDRLPHEVSAVLHSAIDGRRVLRIDDRPDMEPITAADGFYVIGTYNPRNLGGKPLPEAILSRFPLQIEVDTDFDAAESLGVPEKFVALARNLALKARQAVADGGEPVWAPNMRELLAAKRFIDAGFGETFALASVIDSCPVPEDLPTLRAEARSIFGQDAVSMRLGKHV